MAFVTFCLVMGLALLVAALLGWEWLYALWDVEATRAIFGDEAARWFCGICGAAILAIGLIVWLKR